MSIDDQGTLQRRNIAENFNRLSRAHERYRQTTDGRTTTYSEHELEFTFAKNWGSTVSSTSGLRWSSPAEIEVTVFWKLDLASVVRTILRQEARNC